MICIDECGNYTQNRAGCFTSVKECVRFLLTFVFITRYLPKFLPAGGVGWSGAGWGGVGGLFIVSHMRMGFCLRLKESVVKEYNGIFKLPSSGFSYEKHPLPTARQNLHP